ncbi:MAG: hypothetical protein D6742_01035 [Cyanobacteria bacterium J069]|nr:MAG: hypothetical protein D6742_01035 [Cyanobacteria bacterium J069]
MIKGQDSMAGGKRDDPGYSQVSGYIPKDLALKFKIACTSSEVTQSDALEQAVRAWLELQGFPTDQGK